ncbi:MAG: peptidase M14 [Actinomycetota bacterium]|nr:peptidase M14 [Actinomycetota bacterium]
MAYPSSAAAIETQLGTLAAAHPDLCGRTLLPNATHDGRRVSLLRIGGGDGRPVLLTGGAHAREWVPPDALLTMVQRLLDAHADGTDFEVPAFTDTAASPDVSYAAASFSAADVRRIVDALDLHVAPLVNPDGRAFSQSSAANAMWRKNRRPPSAGSTCRGVDINRNFDIAWDFDRYYSRAGAAAVSASMDPCDPQVYIGPAAASEPETRNVVGLLRDRRIEVYVDVHSFSRKILFPWGIDDNQSDEPAQSFANPEWDGRRDGGFGGPYGEYIPNDAGQRLLDEHEALGRTMRAAILDGAGSDPRARSRSAYAVEPSLALYPASGTASDFAFSLNFTADLERPIVGFTLECGSDADGEGGFQPGVAIYPKIEREVHLSMMTLLSRAA